MFRTLGIVLGCVLATSSALAGEGPIVYVGGAAAAAPDCGEIIASTEHVASDAAAAIIPGYDCKEIVSGACPANTSIIDSSGNLVGCTMPGCGGSCTKCSGGANPVSIGLCRKVTNANCILTNTAVSCGTKGSANCFAARPGCGDNNGCDCGTPPAYGGGACSFASCI